MTFLKAISDLALLLPYIIRISHGPWSCANAKLGPAPLPIPHTSPKALPLPLGGEQLSLCLSSPPFPLLLVIVSQFALDETPLSLNYVSQEGAKPYPPTSFKPWPINEFNPLVHSD